MCCRRQCAASDRPHGVSERQYRYVSLPSVGGSAAGCGCTLTSSRPRSRIRARGPIARFPARRAGAHDPFSCIPRHGGVRQCRLQTPEYGCGYALVLPAGDRVNQRIGGFDQLSHQWCVTVRVCAARGDNLACQLAHGGDRCPGARGWVASGVPGSVACRDRRRMPARC